MKSLQKLATAQKKRYYTLFAIAIVLAFIIVFQAYLIADIIDQLFLQKSTFEQVLLPLFTLLGVLALRTSLSYWSGKIGLTMATKVKQDYRKKLIKAYSRRSLADSYQGQSGKKVSVLLDTVDELDPFFSHYIPQRIITTVLPLVILVFIFSQHAYSGLIMLLTAPFIPLFMIIIGGQTQKKSEEKLESLATFSGRFLDTLQGLLTIKLFKQSDRYKQTIKKSSYDFRDTTMSILKVAFMSSLMLEFISMLSIGLVALELSLRLVVFQTLDFFTAFFILLLVPEFFNALKNLGSAFHAGRSSAGAGAKIEEELKQPRSTEAMKWGRGYMANGPGVISLRQVGFQYGTDGFRLSQIDTDLPPYCRVAIVGKSGSGKTTLLNVIAGLFQPSEGQVFIQGEDRSFYEEKEWFGHISYITQHPYLFSGTITENITLGYRATEVEIRVAAQKAGMEKVIQSLKDGYETKIGEGGRGLSGGEKQRLILARAFLKKPSLILFDEPTSGLDLQTEHILQRSIDELSKTATVITVAHRLHTIQQAEHVLFIEQGTIAAQGTHSHLMNNVKAYRELFLQKGREER